MHLQTYQKQNDSDLFIDKIGPFIEQATKELIGLDGVSYNFL